MGARDLAYGHKISAVTEAIVGLAVLLLLAGCQPKVERSLDVASDLLFTEHYVDAERLYRRILGQLDSASESGQSGETESAQRLLILARLGIINSLYLRDYDQAIADYGVLIRGYPRSTEALTAHATLADIYRYQLGRPNAALSELQELLEVFPESSRAPWAILQVVSIYSQMKNYEQARQEATALLSRFSSSIETARARLLVANSYYLQGRFTEAIATYEDLLEARDAEHNNGIKDDTGETPANGAAAERPDSQDNQSDIVLGETDETSVGIAVVPAALSDDFEFKAMVMFELANCFIELDDNERALAYYYAALPDHPNPLLVQRKIEKLKRRVRNAAPSRSIHLPSYVRRRLERKTSTRAAKKPVKKRRVATRSKSASAASQAKPADKSETSATTASTGALTPDPRSLTAGHESKTVGTDANTGDTGKTARDASQHTAEPSPLVASGTSTTTAGPATEAGTASDAAGDRGGPEDSAAPEASEATE